MSPKVLEEGSLIFWFHSYTANGHKLRFCVHSTCHAENLTPRGVCPDRNFHPAGNSHLMSMEVSEQWSEASRLAD